MAAGDVEVEELVTGAFVGGVGGVVVGVGGVGGGGVVGVVVVGHRRFH